MGSTFRIEKSRRKSLAHKIAELTGESCKYLGIPSYAYQIGKIMVTLDGTIDFGDMAESEPDNLLAELAKSGFLIEETPEGYENLLVVEMPANLFDDRVFENLNRILENKGDLIKHALKTPHLNYNVVNSKVRFPWFKVEQGGDAEAYCTFISMLCEFAKNRKRINNKPATSDNPKYSFRCFLIRLGMIGAEYKTARKVLLRNLSGCSAFRSGRF